MKNLVIVESPTKARTLSGFLGKNYQIEASMGHLRDLPKSDIGVDVEHNFEPRYVIPRDKSKRVNELKELASKADTLWLATDPDREGEAISWHILQILEGKAATKKDKGKDKKIDLKDVKRVVFHEITPEAVSESFAHPRKIDINLVDAQQGRRVLDRLVGYKLSPLLWKKVKSGLSAGRVQSVALRLIVDREKEIKAFKPIEYWSVEAELENGKKQIFKAELIEQNGKKVNIGNQDQANKIVSELQKAGYEVWTVTKKEVRRYPAPPFTTSTLQQAGANRLHMSAKKTMALAQALYEHGLITYMRTDSVNLSNQAVGAIRKTIEQNFGKKYLPDKPIFYKTKSKMAQEAHEAIRPTNIGIDADKIKTYEGMSKDHARLYEMIWKRVLASQMMPAVVDQTTVDIKASGEEKNHYLLRAVGSIILFDGWLKLYGKVLDEGESDKEQLLPELSEQEKLKLMQLLPQQHFTEPPPRYNDASLIKKLEELGIGRPSTYAPIISTIVDRYYVERLDRRFIPTEVGNAVIAFLEEYFSDIIDYTFTAQMEDELDYIAEGKRDWQSIIGQFYTPFEKKIEETAEKATKIKIAEEEVDKTCPECGKNLVVRYGKFGKFLACSGFPECKHTETLEVKIDMPCPQCGGEIVVKRTRKGRVFYGCKNWPTCKYASWNKPRPASSKKAQAQTKAAN